MILLLLSIGSAYAQEGAAPYVPAAGGALGAGAVGLLVLKRLFTRADRTSERLSAIEDKIGAIQVSVAELATEIRLSRGANDGQ